MAAESQTPIPDPVAIEPVEPSPPASTVLLSQTLGVIAAIAGLTGTSILLLMAIVGAFYIAVIAAQRESLTCLYVFVAYAALAVLPLVWLDSDKRRPR